MPPAGWQTYTKVDRENANNEDYAWEENPAWEAIPGACAQLCPRVWPHYFLYDWCFTYFYAWFAYLPFLAFSMLRPVFPGPSKFYMVFDQVCSAVIPSWRAAPPIVADHALARELGEPTWAGQERWLDWNALEAALLDADL